MNFPLSIASDVLYPTLLLIPLLPLAACGLILLFLRHQPRVSHWVALSAVGLSFLLAQVIVWNGVRWGGEHLTAHPLSAQIPWLPLGEAVLPMGLLVDPLTLALLFFVSLTCLCIFAYSVGYMQGDPRYAQFFAYISLFAGAMFGLTLADNLLLLFIFWELMGLCSYLLIGFWFEKPSAYRAAVKAFLITRIGDVLMLLGVVYVYAETGTFAFRELLYDVDRLQRLAVEPSVIPGLSIAATIGLLLFAGTVGKSAQFPLHVWLPDAMEGPTPVSAMIHAATMVSAGVYLLIRMFPLLSAGLGPGLGSLPLAALTVIGCVTALVGAAKAVAQTGIKRVLAYSTISQLGYMVAALGAGAYVATTFHLVAHALFKSLLFLGAGSVIVGAHHEQDMRRMGGLGRRMPATFFAFLAGALALAGFPVVSAGFWSKDEILTHFYHAAFTRGDPLSVAAYVTLALAALLTAFYISRQVCLVFLGEPRGDHADRAPESHWMMTLPMIILAMFALFFGFVGVPEDFPGLGPLLGNPFAQFIGPMAPQPHRPIPFDPTPMLISSTVALVGLAAGWLVYGRRPLTADQADPLARWLGPAHGWLQTRYLDRFYRRAVVRPVLLLAGDVYRRLDRGLLDGLLNGVAQGVLGLARLCRAFERHVINRVTDGLSETVKAIAQTLRRRLQTGAIQEYLLQVTLFAFAFLLLYILLLS